MAIIMIDISTPINSVVFCLDYDGSRSGVLHLKVQEDLQYLPVKFHNGQSNF